MTRRINKCMLVSTVRNKQLNLKDKRKQKMTSLLRNCQRTHISPIAGFSMPSWSVTSDLRSSNYEGKAAPVGSRPGI